MRKLPKSNLLMIFLKDKYVRKIRKGKLVRKAIKKNSKEGVVEEMSKGKY